MFRLTWRTLLARKVRLVMSALAIVLGIGFLTGVMVFSNGLGSTFDGIIKGSTPDALVRPAGTGGYVVVADTAKTAHRMAGLLVASPAPGGSSSPVPFH